MKRFLALLMILAVVFAMLPAALAEEGGAAFTFTDVAEDNPHRTAIEYCAENGFVKGVSAEEFDPDGTLTREQMATIWARTFHVTKHNFTDVQKVAHEMDNAIIVMHALGYFKGASDLLFSRYGKISREDAATVAGRTYLPGVDGEDRYMDYEDYDAIAEYARDGVSACKAKGLFDGVFEGEAFNPRAPITRGEISHLIYNFMYEEETPAAPVLTSIAVTAPPADAEYAVGEALDLTGMVVTATYSDGSTGAVTGYTTSVGNGATLTAENTDITVSYTEGGVTKTATLTIVINSSGVTLSAIAITVQPDKTAYTAGETLDLSGMVVTATYSDDSTSAVVGYTTSVADGAVLTAENTDITISYTEGGITKTTTLTLTVSA